ncbi:cytokinin oxidase [Legionella lansingensis]|uniref:Cytokinin oxidase n=1 Tax=Legionella lansingensis TaxID=45067 RepID=A0A0W0W0B3_9GAMM|nr:FAD-binding protein [Legionella lansingensis]KTD25738.1 cytokinin oxidase [Legionella lansingensis]SNV49316.1 cytokinin oxidase [Legionella lansingensis]
MQQMHWNMHQIKHCEKEIGQALLKDEPTLVSYAHDFGKLVQANPIAVYVPQSLEKLQLFLNYAHQNSLPLTIRGNGLSQGGQSLPVDGGVSLHLGKFNSAHEYSQNLIWVDSNASWATMLQISLEKSQIPYVLPYNCHLSVGGVLSAGGVGASSFKFGSVSAHVEALEVMTVAGELKVVDSQSELFKACLSGQGRFAVITKACIKLRSCLKNVRTMFLLYLEQEQWLEDLQKVRQHADYIETFCSPAMQGAKLVAGKRLPFAQWLYVLHVSKEYDGTPPQLDDFGQHLRPWKILHIQDEAIESYLYRHDSRFEAMKLIGQWELAHPWYECFVPGRILRAHLDNLLEKLPLHYALILQIVPMPEQLPTGFFMLPTDKEVYEVMILNPGVHPKLVPSCLQTIEMLDEFFLQNGGKRYLSGYLGNNLDESYWQKHFGTYFEDWMRLKKKYDPHHVFRSRLHL